MREHMGLFRGKRIDNGEWIEGCLLFDPDLGCAQIIGFEYREGEPGIERGEFCESVDPDTVGECTGLRDKNGKLIFEGDIFEWGYAGVKEFRYVVAYDAKLASFVGERHFGFVSLNGIDIEIIGNVHDNPELLKGGEADG